jgi:hypothetical protein|tara:strand:- start:815 stop:982 length:168 start_codon:yes stop_codon:yes gene_type:complete
MVENKILKARSDWKEDHQRLQLLMELIMDWFNQGRVMTIDDFDNIMTDAQMEANR